MHWQDTYDRLSNADRTSPLDGPDLERLGFAAYLIGRDDESTGSLARAHQCFLAAGTPRRAARTAFWLAFVFAGKGDTAQAAGWLARAQRLLDDDGGGPCVERGYVLVPRALQHVRKQELDAAAGVFSEAAEIGARFGERDLENLARQGHARTLIGLGDVARGVAMLDEVMVAVTSGELSPIVSGTIYCSVISACFDIFDVRRAQEWTEALNRWCAAQPDLVPYRGECLVQRAEILRLHGVWRDALEEATRACLCLSQPSARATLGLAFYQLGELHRLRGDVSKAEEAYASASQAGRTPHPGLALLRLAQGRVDAARAAIGRATGEARDRRSRSRMLAASIEILLAAREVEPARAAAGELAAIAATADTPYLRGMSSYGTGAVRLAGGDAEGGLTSLRDAWAHWTEAGVPYEAARARVLAGDACRALGDADGSRIEWEAAETAFEELGAAPDLAAVRERLAGTGKPPDGDLTARELEVLRLVASGMSNRAIAGALRISEKTVARHLSNIFTKLDLSSRAAATAYAFKHHLA